MKSFEVDSRIEGSKPQGTTGGRTSHIEPEENNVSLPDPVFLAFEP
jgi:hypothetical protein